MKRNNIILLITGISWILTSCGNKCEQRGFTELVFDLPVSIPPAKDTFATGDTIWIENSFNNTLPNKNSGNIYTVDNFDFKNNLPITDMNSPSIARSYPDPIIITLEGTTTGNYVGSADHRAIYIDYDYKENRYRYKAAFVADKPGFYLIAFSSFSSGSRDIDITSCPDERITNQFNTNNRTDNNYEMIKNAADPHYAELSKKLFDEAGGYCFYVK